MSSVHVFASYLNPRDSKREIGLHWQRDLAAAFEIVAALHGMGYAPGTLLLNQPPAPGEPQAVLEIDVSHLLVGDLVLAIGRPPLDDEEECPRKRVSPGVTSLEPPIHAIWRRYLRKVSRLHVSLAPRLHDRVPPGFEDRRDVFFREKKGAYYKLMNARDGSGRHEWRGEARTAAFLVREPELWPGGPGYVGLFAMDGPTTLAWATLLRHRYTEMLRRPGFTMVELVPGTIPARAPDLRWALGWKAEVVVHEPSGVEPRAGA